jgi:hypothetical protein
MMDLTAEQVIDAWQKWMLEEFGALEQVRYDRGMKRIEDILKGAAP